MVEGRSQSPPTLEWNPDSQGGYLRGEAFSGGNSGNFEFSEEVALRRSSHFLHHSKVSFTAKSATALLRSQNSPSELKQWICSRFVSLGMVREEILMRARNSFSQVFRDLIFYLDSFYILWY